MQNFESILIEIETSNVDAVADKSSHWLFDLLNNIWDSVVFKTALFGIACQKILASRLPSLIT